MYNLQFLVGKGNTFYDYSELVTSCTVSGRKGAAPRSISVTLFDDEGYAMQRASVDVSKGQTCVLKLNGSEIFRGLLMTETKSSSRKLTLKAWDNAIYLCNSKNSFSYKKKRADQIFKDCCKKAGLTVGGAVNTGKVISELVKTGSTYWDVIQEALSETYSATGNRFYVSSEKGKLYLRQRKAVDTMPQLEVTTNTESYEQTRSIYDTRTRITLVTSKNKTKKSWTNTDLEKQIGKFADVQTVDNDATATELSQKIATFKEEKSVISQSLTWTGTGDISVISGGCVYVIIGALGVKQVMYVDEDTHTFSGGKHQMKLKLNFVPDYKTSSSGGSSGTYYKVNAKSGLNLRTGPNQTIIATMPNGTKVESDGKVNGSWIHVKYNGKWGYAYSAYLKKA
jgi:hypothetical protein